MEVQLVRTLILQGRPLGLRFTTAQGVFDADRSSLAAQGVYNLHLPIQAELKPVKDQFLTDEELSGQLVEDISDNPSVLASILIPLRHSQLYRSLFFVLQPHHQSLDTFMADDGWRVEKVKSEDSGWFTFVIYQPDGVQWSGPWADRHLEPEQAKMTFHHEQVKLSILRGEEVPFAVVDQYPDLEFVLTAIKDLQKDIAVKSNNLLEVSVDGRKKTVNLDQYPYTKSGQADFVDRSRLIPRRHTKTVFEDPLFNARVVLAIAINRALQEYENLRHQEVI